MSFWNKPPREVYRVCAEDELLSGEGIVADERTAGPIDFDTSALDGDVHEGEAVDTRAHKAFDRELEHRHGTRVAGIATAVTVVACVLVLLHLSHAGAPDGRTVAAGHAFSHAERRAFATGPATAPPKVHVAGQIQRKARVPNPHVAHPPRPSKRRVAEHVESLKKDVFAGAASRYPPIPEFNFER